MKNEEYFRKLEEKLDELFPKKECKERSQALVLFAFANIYLEEFLQKQKEEIWDLIFSSYPKDMENFDTITENQAYRLLKTFWDKLEQLK